MEKKLIVAFLALLLLAQPCFSLWNQTVAVGAVDLNGKPVEAADVKITYQQSSVFSENDGIAIGKTDSSGVFYANLSNRVPEAYEAKLFRAVVSTYYWGGASKAGIANESGVKTLDFIVPYELGQANVKVLSSDRIAVGNASVYLVYNGSVVWEKKTSVFGVASFSVPIGFPFAGYAAYGAETQSFNSSGAVGAEGMRTVTVAMKANKLDAGASSAGNGTNTILLMVIGKDGKIVPSQAVVFSFDGKNTTIYTSPQGTASFSSPKTGNISVSAYRYEHRYNGTYYLSGSTSNALELGPLLKITSFTKAVDGKNCYKLLANVTDPRLNLPLDVKFSKYGPAANVSLVVAIEDSGLFSSRVCVTADTQIKATASNKYDTAEAVLVLTYAPSPKPVVVSNVTLPHRGETEMTEKTDDAVLGAVLLLIAIALGGVLVFGRKQVTQLLRFVGEYLRQMLQNAERKKKGAPPVPPPVAVPPEKPQI